MAWSYDGDPAENQKDAVRWLIGDTDESDPLASDEEIWYALSDAGSTKAAAAVVADAIAARLQRRATSRQVGRLRIQTQAKAQEFRDLADRLREEGGVPIVSPWVGGTKDAEKISANQDSDRIPTYFRRGQMDGYASADDQP